MGITLNKDLILQVIKTLKGIDVRGYESMDKLVGLVMLFENIIQQAEEMAKKQAEEEAKKQEET